LTTTQAWQFVSGAEANEGPIGAQMLRRIVAGAFTWSARLVTGAEARWVGCVPSESSRIYFANHTSHADFIVLWSSLTRRLRARTFPVAAADYWEYNAARRYLAKDVFRSVLVEREHVDRAHNPLFPMLKVLDGGNSLILFPEGTRGDGRELMPFKCGIYHLAHARPHVELVPVWIDNMYRVLPRGAVLPAPLLCSVSFGEPTNLFPGEEKNALLARLHQSVKCLAASCSVKRS
jgi:1-acyl-sn-glycerol-3-phosphate acyltransferase